MTGPEAVALAGVLAWFLPAYLRVPLDAPDGLTRRLTLTVTAVGAALVAGAYASA